MVRTLMSLLLTVACVLAQTQGASPGPQTKPAGPAAGTNANQAKPAPAPALKPGAPAPAGYDPASAVAPRQVVVTVHGVCKTTPRKPGRNCVTVMTRQQFEALLNAVTQPGQSVPPAARRNLVQTYAEYLTFAQAATKAGLENDPRFKEIVRIQRLQALTDLYRRSLEEKYRNPSPAEIDAYYKQNLEKYDELTLTRIFIPRTNPALQDKDKEAWQHKAGQLASDVRQRAAQGEEIEKLQKESYASLGLETAPPPSAMGTRRKGMLPAIEESMVLALKVGEVSKVILEPQAYVIYKLEARQSAPLDKVKDEIAREIFRHKLDSEFNKIKSATRVDFNDEYFGAPAAPRAQPVTSPKEK